MIFRLLLETRQRSSSTAKSILLIAALRDTVTTLPAMRSVLSTITAWRGCGMRLTQCTPPSISGSFHPSKIAALPKAMQFTWSKPSAKQYGSQHRLDGAVVARAVAAA